MAATSIEWTDKTWNPTTGCTRVSEGCRNCYAFALHDQRHAAFKAGKKVPAQYARPFKELQLFPDRLSDPLHWRTPCRVFVNSMSDLFHEDVPDDFIRRVFGVMSLCGQHTFQILTKRPARMAAWFADPENTLSACQAEETVHRPEPDATRTPTGRSRVRDLRAINGTRGPTVGDGNYWPIPNVWLGVSVEDQKRADERIPLLLQTPAAVRFLSCEPLLGGLNLSVAFHQIMPADRVSWVIVGGESGPGARAFQIEWARGLIRQCREAGVPCFVKQLGSRPYSMPYQGTGRVYTLEEIRANGDAAHEANEEFGRILESVEYLSLRDKKGGDMAEWPSDLRVREFPKE